MTLKTSKTMIDGAKEKKAIEPVKVPLADVVKGYLYGSDRTSEKWMEVAKGRPDFEEFKSRVERALS